MDYKREGILHEGGKIKKEGRKERSKKNAG